MKKIKCTHNLPKEYWGFSCTKGDYVVIDAKKKVILKRCGCSQEAWTTWQDYYFNADTDVRDYIKRGLYKNMKKYLKR